ncbi:MAG: TatD family hydrolase [Aggregatilineales bacterium]
MKLFDTHCHLDFAAYDSDRSDVISRAAAAGVAYVLNPGIDLATSQAAVDLATQFSSVYAAVGVHPNSSADFTPLLLESLRTLTACPKVVAVGEIGLDYYWDHSPRSSQLTALEQQLVLASDLCLPVIIHNREASTDLLPVLESWISSVPPALKQRPGVLHSFSVSADVAERALALGFCLGFTGPITYKKADELRAVARAAPLDRLLVETDGPFLTPAPFRGRRNEPVYVAYIVRRLAEVKGLTETEISRATTSNAKRLFAINN